MKNQLISFCYEYSSENNGVLQFFFSDEDYDFSKLD